MAHRTRSSVARWGFRSFGMVLAEFCLLFFLLLSFFVPGCGPAEDDGGVDIIRALSGNRDLSCYERADGPKPLTFPRDLGPHEGFKTEWWYYTGNLTTGGPDQAGRTFGFQLTFFRQALDCQRPEGDSAWRTGQLYFAHFALTDGQNRLFYPARRMNRGSLGIAGAQSHPFRVWIDNWSAALTPEGIRLQARERTAAKGGDEEQEIAIDLVLTRTKPTVLQGEKGWSRKGPTDSNGSYYYSYPGMAVQGRIRLGSETVEADGRAWFDHEWSTAALGEKAVGWDWFALHITAGPHAGTDLMVCQVRQKQGPPFGFGSVSRPDGSYLILTERQFAITPLDRWTSPASKKTYPSRWRIRLPEWDLDLTVAPVVADQEHPRGFAYYEGAVRVSEAESDGADTGSLGRGYVEMTGY